MASKLLLVVVRQMDCFVMEQDGGFFGCFVVGVLCQSLPVESYSSTSID
jgi:hypothetical protein